MTFIIRIDPDGTITREDGDDLAAVALEGLLPFGGWKGKMPGGFDISEDEPTLDVVSMFPNPIAPTSRGEILVAAMHQWGRFMGLPVNLKAWALYGRSPLVGPVWVAHDMDRLDATERRALDEEFITTLEAGTDWLPASVRERMVAVAADEGCEWPS